MKHKQKKEIQKECYFTAFVHATNDIEEGIILSLLFQLSDNSTHPKWSQTKICDFVGFERNDPNRCKVKRILKRLKDKGFINYQRAYFNNLTETEFTITTVTYKVYLMSITDPKQFANELTTIAQKFGLENNTVNAIIETWKANQENNLSLQTKMKE